MKKNNSLSTSNSSLGGGILDNHKPRLERFIKNKKQKQILIGTIIGIIVLIGGITLYRTFAMYKDEKSYNVIQGKVPDFRLCHVNVNTQWNFTMSEMGQEFTTPCKGNYQFELWGAQGGTNSISGKGGYTSGILSLEENENFYIFVGGSNRTNGGGISTSNGENGGGSTDIRLVNGNWSDFDSLKSRIMVAAGGGGFGALSAQAMANGGNAGGLIGYDGGNSTTSGLSGIPKGASQTAGGISNTWSNSFLGEKGSFGKGGGAPYSNSQWTYGKYVGGGGGSGYYGGGSGSNANGNVSSGGGGSSFISGHKGCDAIEESSTSNAIKHTGFSTHYSGYVFTDTKMIDGAGYSWTDTKGEHTGMPTHDGTEGNMDGNTGDGYARITYLGL